MLIFVVCLWFAPNDFVPFGSIVKYFPSLIVPFYIRFTNAFLIVFALYFMYNLVFNTLITNKLDPNRTMLWFCYAGVFMTLAACAKITHQFSQVYVAQATPFLVVLLVKHHQFGRVKIFKCAFVIGSGLYALAQLRSHYA